MVCSSGLLLWLFVGCCCLILVPTAMSSLKELTDTGLELGLEGETLQAFIRDQQALQREERAAERKHEQERREYEKQRLLEEAEMKKMEHIQKLELLQAEAKVKSNDTSSKVAAKAPKMPPFEESKDDIDSYLRRFERYAHAQGWKIETWATSLSALLKGRALDVYALLPYESACDYDALKTALLKRFELTEDGFRQKFRSCRPENGETFQQFSVRLGSYFNRWLEIAKVPKTFNGLYDLVLRDQFLSLCNKELLLFLKERIPDSIENMSRLADQYREARRAGASSLVHPSKKSEVQQAKITKPQGQGQQRQGNSQQTGKVSQGSFSNKDKKCYKCGMLGHIASECLGKKRQNAVAVVSSSEAEITETEPEVCGAFMSYTNTVTYANAGSPNLVTASCNDRGVFSNMPTTRGKIGDKVVSVLRDTGCSGVVVKRELVPAGKMTGKSRDCYLADGSMIQVPLAVVDIDTPYYTGEVEAWCLTNPLFDLILGNIQNVRGPEDPDPEWSMVQAVQTRNQAKVAARKPTPLKVAKTLPTDVSPDEIRIAQQSDDTLTKVRSLADSNHSEIEGKAKFFYREGILFRKFQSPGVEHGRIFTQLVVPKQYRVVCMQLAHDSLMSGHLGADRTVNKVLAEFFWPGIQADVRRFCRSCDICQRTTAKGKTRKVPLAKMPVIDEPFRRVAVDLVGPLQPATDRGNRYILTLVDYATRYPEAVALKGIETEQVAEALVEIFCRVGVPREMLTDMGAQFTSSLMTEVSRLISLKQLSTTPYHPMCNGLVERFNGSLKQILKRLCAEKPKDWDKYLGAVLFAYRDVPQESLGFSPFELVYGRSVRGPMSILRELWTKEIEDQQVKSTYQYVVDLREKLETTCQLARENLEKASSRYRAYYNKKAKDRDMEVGEKVLVLLPTSSNKLLMQWKGPFVIKEKLGRVDYRIEMDGKLKTFHANMLKKYLDRSDFTLSNAKGVLNVVAVAVVDVECDSSDVHNEMIIDPPTDQSTEGPNNVHVSSKLSSSQMQQISDVLQEFPDVLSDKPGRTTLAEHDIKLTSTSPVRTKPYPVPFTMRDTVCQEVEKMLQLGIIEPSESPYSSPIVIVKKKDNTNRFCIDFRAINRVTIFDAETIPNADEIFANLSGCKYVSKFDLCKGYWQLPLTDSAKPLTAFQTPLGLYQFRVMPFGLVNASASFSRLMRKLLHGMTSTDNFIDDIMLYSSSFSEHIALIRELLLRLRNSNLTAKPSKCFVAYESLECLGHIVGSEQLRPVPEKVQAIQNFSRPGTKKQVKSFLGLVGFYRKFIPNFSAIASPLSDLTKKGQPNKVIWNQAQENAFDTLRNALTSFPILKLPNLHEHFILQTDASDKGIGAVLLQEETGMKMPVAYASRKLKPSEVAYSTIEKECLAIVWAVVKFQRYLYGKEFILETDHQPLIYLSRAKVSNARLMRWALLLQPYRFRIVAIKGSENVGADCLSRL